MSWHRVKPAGLLLHVLLALAGLLCLFPFFWTLVVATNTTADIHRFPPKFTFGSQFDDNVRHVLANGLLRLDAEHRDRRGLVTALVLFFDSLAAVPQLQMTAALGWVGSLKALIIPGAANTFGICGSTSRTRSTTNWSRPPR